MSNGTLKPHPFTSRMLSAWKASRWITMERGINRAKTVLYVMADRLGDLGEMDELMKVIGMNRAWTETDKQGKRRRKSREKS